MINKKICIVGCFQNGLDLAEHLLNNKINICKIISISPMEAKKNKVSGYVNYTQFCKKNRIPLYHVKKYNMKHRDDIHFFKSNRFDILLIGGWNRLIPSEILKTLNIFGIGVHGSNNYLPLGRGRSPMNWSILRGEKRIILHFFKLASKIDQGEILKTQMFEINNFDDIQTLYFKYSIVFRKVIIDILNSIEAGEYILKPQIGKPTYFPKRSEKDGLINFKKMNVYEIYNFVRAQSKPYPGAFSYINGQKIIIWKAFPFDSIIDFNKYNLGEIIEIFGNQLIVKCLGGLLIVKEFTSKIKPRKNIMLEEVK